MYRGCRPFKITLRYSLYLKVIVGFIKYLNFIKARIIRFYSHYIDCCLFVFIYDSYLQRSLFCE